MIARLQIVDGFLPRPGHLLFIALVVGAIFWAIGQPINPFTVILYSLCIGNFLSPPMQWLHALYEKPAPYDWLIFLAVLCVVMLPVYLLSSVIVWWFAPPGPQSLGHLLATGWKMPFLITFVYGVMNFLYGKTRARLERRNVELQGMVQVGRSPAGNPGAGIATRPRNPAVAFAQGNSAAAGNRRSHRLAARRARSAEITSMCCGSTATGWPSALPMSPAREFPPLCSWLMSRPACAHPCATWIVRRACAGS